ncbi:MAG: peptidoglycan-associated lipoprotein Pal [Nitrospirota bacterium]
MKNGKMLFPVLILSLCVCMWGCPKKAEVTSAPEGQKEAASKETSKAASDQQAGATTPETKERSGLADESTAGLQPIFFDFDKSFVSDDAKKVMKANAAWLKANPNSKLRIEGNCDERGTKEYNQALGQRRAASAKKYLSDLGVPATRISLISYGKEKPACTESTEACWQKNRRADFVAQ